MSPQGRRKVLKAVRHAGRDAEGVERGGEWGGGVPLTSRLDGLGERFAESINVDRNRVISAYLAGLLCASEYKRYDDTRCYFNVRSKANMS